MRLEAERRALVHALRRIAAAGLVLGAAGNASVRDPQSRLVVISPSALPYETLEPDEVCVVDAAGELLEGGRPSIELPMHLAILSARADANAVVHTHSPYATALSCVLDEIPVVAAEQPAFVGGATPVSPYAPTGTAEAGEAVLAAAGDRFAAVIRNHGRSAWATASSALSPAPSLSRRRRGSPFLARQVGDPSLLPADEVERVRKLSGR